MTLETRCKDIRLILSDVDGVLSDGSIVIDNQGVETKRFNIRDGMGIKLWQRAGNKFGVITGRTSQIVTVWADHLALDVVRQGANDKLPTMQEILAQWNMTANEVCYIGDDLLDVTAIKYAALGVAPPDAVEQALATADYVTKTPGGEGVACSHGGSGQGTAAFLSS